MTKREAFGCVLAGLLFVLPRGVAAGEKGLYRFMAGDNIRINVPSHAGYDQNLMVQPDGRIYFPLAGEIQVVGMTVPELQERIRVALEIQLEKPVIAVSLISTRDGAGWITVLGAVGNAGRLEPRAGWTVPDAITAAGIQSDADLARVQLVREGKTIRTVDLSKMRESGKIEEVIPVQAGDILVVPEVQRAPIAVLGQVGRPGVVEWKKGLTVLDALNAAGGPTPKANLTTAELSRGGEVQPLDLEALLKGDHALNVVLRPGDSLTVPECQAQVFVLGRVAQPNIYALTRERRVLDVLMSAGGPSPDANLAGARLLRKGADGKPRVIDLNLDRMLARGDLKSNEIMQPNDILVVPAKGKSKNLRDYLDWVWPINSLYSLLRTFR